MTQTSSDWECTEMLIDLKKLYRKYGLRSRVSGVLHVGAHLGEEARAYRDVGFRPVIWVEANPDLIDQLIPIVRHYNQKVIEAVVSDEVGKEITFHITRDPEGTAMSSSLLELALHKKYAPWVKEVEQKTLVTTTIDTLAEQYDDINKCNFINLDIQGAELLALRGAENFLEHCQYVYTEVNENYLYKDCALLPEMDAFLGERGFTRHETVMTKAEWGDAFYVK